MWETLVFQLVVDDGLGHSLPNEVAITVVDVNAPLCAGWHRKAIKCLDRCISDEAIRTREITACEDICNTAQATIAWCFTTTDAWENCIVCTY
jgi:hypothetical protein